MKLVCQRLFKKFIKHVGSASKENRLILILYDIYRLGKISRLIHEQKTLLNSIYFNVNAGSFRLAIHADSIINKHIALWLRMVICLIISLLAL